MFFNFFNFMKWRRLKTSSLLASSVLVSTLSLFRYCLISFSSFSISWSLLLSFSFSVSFSVSSFSAWGWIDSMNSERCLWIHLIIWQSCLHLNAFELRRLSQRWIFKRAFFRSWNNFFHLHINMTLHLQISMKILHVLRQSSSIFRSRRTIAWSYHLWFSYTKKRINDFYLKISFESINSKIISQQSVSINSHLIFNVNARLQSTNILLRTFDSEFCESKTIRW